MQVPNEILMKFPVILRNKLVSKEMELYDNIEFCYEEICAYRCITRKNTDDLMVTRKDFMSNAEIGRKKIRGEGDDLENIPEYYGVSLFTDKKQLELRLKLPKKNKKIIKGNIFCKGGPILRGKNTHICWWLYEDADVSNFKIENCEG